jgi:hypothetical protein
MLVDRRVKSAMIANKMSSNWVLALRANENT